MNKYRIMVIDDDEYSTELYSMIIEWHSYDHFYHSENNALEALRHLEELDKMDPEKFPDFILLDLKMPEMHGFSFLKEFENNFVHRNDKTKFIITTSSIRSTDREKAMDFSSVIDYIVKPIPGDLLQKLIDEGCVPKENGE